MTLSDVVDGFDALRPGDPERFAAMEEVVLHYQRRNNPVVAAYGASRYLPIDAFKHAPVCTFDPEDAEAVFLSSGTGSTGSGGGSRRSRHYVRDLDLCHRSIDAGFEAAFGTGPFTFIAHLPVYESQGEQSSLVAMARRIAERFGNFDSGLFLEDDHVLKTAIDHAASSGERLILLGAAFGLLDLIESGRAPRLPEGSTIVETGGMKTHRRSVGRTDLHARLSEGFGVAVQQVRSEYGMCELLSQCWTGDDGLFRPPPWMSVRIVQPENPDSECAEGERGVVAVVDLANVYSASAIVTQDVGVRRGDGFEVLGRMSAAELRGCNFLFETTP